MPAIHKEKIIVAGQNSPRFVEAGHTGAYEPSNISSVYHSSFWQWRRVAEWYRYINDPMENKKGHIIT